MKNKIDIQSSY